MEGLGEGREGHAGEAAAASHYPECSVWPPRPIGEFDQLARSNQVRAIDADSFSVPVRVCSCPLCIINRL